MTSSVSNCDVDIDAAQGIEHVFEVLGDSVKGPTDPYDIHEILLAGQRLDRRLVCLPAGGDGHCVKLLV